MIHLLSHSIPIIAVQASLIEHGGHRSLFFTKVLDTYEEIDDGTSIESGTYCREDWLQKSKWTLETAESLMEIARPTFTNPELNYVGAYVAITVSGNNYMWLNKRSHNKSQLNIRVIPALQEEATQILDGKNITYVRKAKRIVLTVDKEMVDQQRELFVTLAEIVKRSWAAGG